MQSQASQISIHQQLPAKQKPRNGNPQIGCIDPNPIQLVQNEIPCLKEWRAMKRSNSTIMRAVWLIELDKKEQKDSNSAQR